MSREGSTLSASHSGPTLPLPLHLRREGQGRGRPAGLSLSTSGALTPVGHFPAPPSFVTSEPSLGPFSIRGRTRLLEEPSVALAGAAVSTGFRWLPAHACGRDSVPLRGKDSVWRLPRLYKARADAGAATAEECA